MATPFRRPKGRAPGPPGVSRPGPGPGCQPGPGAGTQRPAAVRGWPVRSDRKNTRSSRVTPPGRPRPVGPRCITGRTIQTESRLASRPFLPNRNGPARPSAVGRTWELPGGWARRTRAERGDMNRCRRKRCGQKASFRRIGQSTRCQQQLMLWLLSAVNWDLSAGPSSAVSFRWTEVVLKSILMRILFLFSVGNFSISVLKKN